MSDTAELIDSINAAKAKDDLKTIADIIGYKIHGNKGLERTQAEMIEIINGSATETTTDGEGLGTEGAEGDTAELNVNEPEVKTNAPRSIRNTKTGVRFTWTEALAKMPEMRED